MSGALISFYFVRIVGRKTLISVGFLLNTLLAFGAAALSNFEYNGLATMLMFLFSMNQAANLLSLVSLYTTEVNPDIVLGISQIVIVSLILV